MEGLVTSTQKVLKFCTKDALQGTTSQSGHKNQGRRVGLRAQPLVPGPHALAALRYSPGAVAPTRRGDAQQQQHDALHQREHGDERNMMLLFN
ncbi:hypothetical protein EYF80_039709 [Liparis tanakae]|uniref:Uncharacterized protein n=1 Tax=Liparis tanakae TaxID=230148 RepID=A0A4Z2GAX8_9TELE|nr:hypothetical protein EYF80_039709 [Liparis tanakae]